MQPKKIDLAISELLRKEHLENYFNNSDFETIKLKLNSNIKMDTGKFCNSKCHFCYYLDSVSKDDRLTLEKVKEIDFDDILKNVTNIEFSGGEPTLVKDISEIMKYLSHKRYYLTKQDNLKFSFVTNGWNVKSFLMDLKNNKTFFGINTLSSFLFSLHGNKEVHESITKLKGSYDRIRIAINYIKRNFPKILVRVNIVLSGQQINQEFLNIIKDFINNGIQVNLLPLNYWEDQSKSVSNQEKIYNDINIIMSYIYSNDLLNQNNNYKEAHQANLINIRYARICKIDEKFKPFILGHFDHIFDKLDWNKLWYPSYENQINIYPRKKLTKDSIINTIVKDAELSHHIDKTCSKCPDFKNLKCDGIKYLNQKEKILDTNLEDYKFRVDYIKQKIKDC